MPRKIIQTKVQRENSSVQVGEAARTYRVKTWVRVEMNMTTKRRMHNLSKSLSKAD